MAYYYVKNGGTATGDGGRTTTQRTSTWNASTADYYDSTLDIFTVPATAPVAGDFVLASSTHNKLYTATTTITVIDGVFYISVDNANQENYLKGAKERTAIATGNDLTITLSTSNSVGAFYGFIFENDDQFKPNGRDSALINYYECDFSLVSTGSSDTIWLNIDGACAYFNSCNFNFAHIGQHFLLSNASSIILDGCTTSGSATTTLVKGGGSGGVLIRINSCNLSSGATSMTLIDVGDVVGDDNLYATIDKTILPTSTSILISPVTLPNIDVKATSIAFGTATDEYHYFEEQYFNGSISEDTAIYRDAGSTYDGTNEFSAEMVGNADTSFYNPLKFQLTKLYIDTADYTTDITFTVHLARDNGTLLQDDEFWIEIEHPDGVDNALGVLVGTKPAPLAAGTNLTNEAGGWTHTFTGSEGTDFEFMSANSGAITIGASAGNIATGAIRVNVYLAINDTVFVCGKVEIT